mmetsp:Transcript_13815/g.18101  ORF Transcript_13815/g.18101 Transcript_13815/m.18101 type:complete len:434 (-) Transcript_13815:20-1321(-)
MAVKLTVIRMKRPRSQAPLDVVRMSSISRKRSKPDDAEVMALTKLMDANSSIDVKREDNRHPISMKSATTDVESSRNSAMIFKRKFEDDIGANSSCSSFLSKQFAGILDGKADETIHIVDCAAAEVEVEENGGGDNQPKKRTKVVMVGSHDVLLTKDKAKKKVGVLDPLTRRVDQCLVECYENFNVKPFLTLITGSKVIEASNGSIKFLNLINRRCSNGRGCALHLAALTNDRNSILALLSSGANPMVHDNDNLTPAQVASLSGNNEISYLLNQRSGLDDEETFVYDYYVMQTQTDSTDHLEQSGTSLSKEDTRYEDAPMIEFLDEDVDSMDEDENDHDHDSNDEGFEGNDYPDDVYDSDSSDDAGSRGWIRMETNHNFSSSNRDGIIGYQDYDDYEHESLFGTLRSSPNPLNANLNNYAYDSELDGSDIDYD